MLARLTLLATLALPLPARACETALLLAIDVSGSIDAGEYALQVAGLARALEDRGVRDMLVQDGDALSVMQWSGRGQQAFVIPWTAMDGPGEVAAFAARVRAMPRAFAGSDTAVGEAMGAALARFGPVAGCARRVIDISGDGPENAGNSAARERGAAMRAGIEINAIAIEDAGEASPISRFYSAWVITRGGFTVTARGLEDYARAIREKLLRELARQIG